MAMHWGKKEKRKRGRRRKKERVREKRREKEGKRKEGRKREREKEKEEKKEGRKNEEKEGRKIKERKSNLNQDAKVAVGPPKVILIMYSWRLLICSQVIKIGMLKLIIHPKYNFPPCIWWNAYLEGEWFVMG